MFIIVKERLQRLEMTQVWARYDDGVQDGSVIVRLNAMVGGVGLGSKQSDAPMPICKLSRRIIASGTRSGLGRCARRWITVRDSGSRARK